MFVIKCPKINFNIPILQIKNMFFNIFILFLDIFLYIFITLLDICVPFIIFLSNLSNFSAH